MRLSFALFFNCNINLYINRFYGVVIFHSSSAISFLGIKFSETVQRSTHTTRRSHTMLRNMVEINK